MKVIKKILSQTSIVVSLEIALAIMLIVLVVLFLILPSFSSWQENREQKGETDEKIQKVEKNILAIKSLDSVTLETILEQYEEILPAEGDALRFFTLAEVIAKASGMEVSAAQLNIAKTTPGLPPPPAEGAQTPAISSGGTTAAGQATPTSLGGSLSVKISFTGPFTSVMKMLGNFNKADRANLIKSLSIDGSEETGTAVAIEFNLPLFVFAEAASAEIAVFLSEEEINFLQNYARGLKFTAEPASGATGKSDPFR